MANSTAFRGGSVHVGNSPYSDADNSYVYDTISYPSGNLNLAGARPVTIHSVVPTNGSGYTAATVASDGYVRLYTGTARLNFSRNPDVGGVITLALTGFTWAGGMVGAFSWSTVPTKPGSISATRSIRDVTVAITGSSSDGGSAVTSYRVQRAWSANGSTGWSAWEDEQAISSSYKYEDLTAGRYYKFRTFARNANGDSEARESGAIFVPAGGKRKVAGSFQSTTIAKRKSAGAFVDLTIAKRRVGGAWVDLS